MSIRTARSVYSAIGGRLRRVDCDPLAGRQYVPLGHKLVLMASSVLRSAGRIAWGAAAGRFRSRTVSSSFPTTFFLFPGRPPSTRASSA